MNWNFIDFKSEKQNVNKILSRFPKKRPKISKELQEIYADEYKKNRGGKSPLSFLAQKLESWMHKKVSEAYPMKQLKSYKTLEIGAGTLNHIFYEYKDSAYDFIEPLHFLYSDSPYLSNTRKAFSDISEINTTNEYNRIISIAVLEHVTDLPNLIKKSINLMADDGVFVCGIPSEGGFLWGSAWRLTTGLEFRLRTGLNYSEFMRYEHLNNAFEIEILLQYFFKDVKIQRLGFGRHFSIYTFIECRNPKYIHL